MVPEKRFWKGKQEWRVVVDYKKLTVGDKYSLPNISNLLDKLGKCQYFTTLDLAFNFHQIEIEPKDIQKTASTIENGHSEFVKLPFSLKDALLTS